MSSVERLCSKTSGGEFLSFLASGWVKWVVWTVDNQEFLLTYSGRVSVPASNRFGSELVVLPTNWSPILLKLSCAKRLTRCLSGQVTNWRWRVLFQLSKFFLKLSRVKESAQLVLSGQRNGASKIYALLQEFCFTD